MADLTIKTTEELKELLEEIKEELNFRRTYFFVDRSSDFPPGAQVMSTEGETGIVIKKIDFDSVLVEWPTGI